MKKKALAIALAVALIAIMVSGSLAYFIAEDKATNTFTIGSVDIEIYENGEATEDDTVLFGMLIPVVNTTDPTADENYFDKEVDVKNTGRNDAYIRTHIAVPTALINYLQLDMTLTGWEFIGTTAASVDGIAYTVFTYDYLTAVAPGGFTAELLQGVYLKSEVDLTADADGNLVFILRDADGNETHNSGFVAHTKNTDGSYTTTTVRLLVAAQAIQTDNFTGTATDALNEGFGEGKNPWQ